MLHRPCHRERSLLPRLALGGAHEKGFLSRFCFLPCTLIFFFLSPLFTKTTFVAYQASTRGGMLGVSVVGDRVTLRGTAVTFYDTTIPLPK